MEHVARPQFNFSEMTFEKLIRMLSFCLCDLICDEIKSQSEASIIPVRSGFYRASASRTPCYGLLSLAPDSVKITVSFSELATISKMFCLIEPTQLNLFLLKVIQAVAVSEIEPYD